MIEITKCELKRIRKEFPFYCNGKTMKTGSMKENYVTRSQTHKSNRGKGYITSSIQFEHGESNESKIARLDELMSILKIIRGNPEAREAYDKLKVEKYKIQNPQWWDKTKGVKHPYFFAVGMNWIKDKNQ